MDFEKAWISSVNHLFTESCVIECYFHFKQALHRRLEKYRLLVCQKWRLTIIKIVHLNQAIGYIKSLTIAKIHLTNFGLTLNTHGWFVFS
ncbi:hypothetical protein HZS_2212 [Henneguya salminicola]|nr:hypothetical protein HZS_2212 [Henneguya salminicola]